MTTDQHGVTPGHAVTPGEAACEAFWRQADRNDATREYSTSPNAWDGAAQAAITAALVDAGVARLHDENASLREQLREAETADDLLVAAVLRNKPGVVEAERDRYRQALEAIAGKEITRTSSYALRDIAREVLEARS